MMDNIRKVVISLITFFLSFTVLHGQIDKHEYEIQIVIGAGYFGITKISLFSEGLLCRTSIEKNKRVKNKINFIQIKKLNLYKKTDDFNKKLNIFNIIHDSILPNLDSINNLNESVEYPEYYMDIQVYDVINKEHYFIKYKLYNESINKLILFMNDAVPPKLKKYYQIKNWVYNRYIM